MKFSHRPHGKLTIACCLQGGGVYVYSGTVTITSSSIHGNSAVYVRAHAHNFPSPQWEFLLTCPIRFPPFNLLFYQGAAVRANHACKTPSPPWETHVLLVACRAAVSMSMVMVAQWPSHRLPSVGTQLTLYALMFGISHRPDGRIADALASTHACTTANASVNYSRYVPHRP